MTLERETLDVDAVLALAPEFARAPSAHNTQPWLLTTTRDSDGDEPALLLSWHPERTLPVADPTMRDNFLSLGAYVEAVLTIASEAGHAMRFEPDIDLADCRAGRFVGSTASRHLTPFTRADVAARGCSRRAYAEGSIATADLDAADAHARAARASLRHIPSRELIATLVAADRHMWADAEVIAELRSWLRLSRRHPGYTRDGLTYEALAMSGVEAGALRVLASPPVYQALRRAGLPELLASFSKPLLDYAGSVLVLVGPASAPAGSMEAHALELRMGQVLLRTWLELSTRNISVHPLSQIIDAPDTYEALHRLLGVDDDCRLFAIFRAGATQAAPITSSRLVG